MATGPRISMLWESTSPAAALRDRFGFADADAAAAWLGEVLWDKWSLAVDHCERLVISDGNMLAWIGSGGRRLVAKWSVYPHLFQRLADTTSLTMWLQARGIPVAAPLPTGDGRLRVESENVSLGVCPVITGDLLDATNPTHVADAGHTLAGLHEALAAYPHRIDGGTPTRREQLVHNDFRSANLLHDGTRITAVLDLEDATYGTRVADLARAAVLLGTRYRNWEPTSPPVREAFVAAYRDRVQLSRTEENELRRGVSAVLRGLGWEHGGAGGVGPSATMRVCQPHARSKGAPPW